MSAKQEKPKRPIGGVSLSLLVVFTMCVAVFIGFAWRACAPAWAAQSSKSAVLFEDISGHWAESSIMSLSVLELVQGYPDKTFEPEQLLSRLETIVLFLRAGGFTAEAEKLAKQNQKSSTRSGAAAAVVETKNTPQTPWGQSYVDLAVEKGFLVLEQPENYDYDGPATRLEAAELLARTIYLLPPAGASAVFTAASTAQTFSDVSRLNETEQAVVAAVVNAGIISGYPDGTFRPQEPLTRAEATMMLSRLVDQGWIKVSDQRRLTGWISNLEINKERYEITFTNLSGTRKIKAADYLQCFQDGEARTLPQTLNYSCEIFLDGSKQAGLINMLERNYGSEEIQTKRCSVKSVILGGDNLIIVSDMTVNELTLPIAWDAVLLGGKNTKGFSSLKEGDFVDIKLDQGQVKEITRLDVKTISGTVDRIDGRRLYLNRKLTAKKPAWFNYYSSARIVRNDGTAMDDVAPGDKVTITYLDPIPDEIDDEQAIEIKVTSKR